MFTASFQGMTAPASYGGKINTQLSKSSQTVNRELEPLQGYQSNSNGKKGVASNFRAAPGDLKRHLG